MCICIDAIGSSVRYDKAKFRLEQRDRASEDVNIPASWCVGKHVYWLGKKRPCALLVTGSVCKHTWSCHWLFLDTGARTIGEELYWPVHYYIIHTNTWFAFVIIIIVLWSCFLPCFHVLSQNILCYLLLLHCKLIYVCITFVLFKS